MSLALVLLTYAVVGLAIQHAAYIIQYGSIFDKLRAWSKHELSPWWFHELLHCQLCTITQLSLWLWALPVGIAGWGVWGGPAAIKILILIMLWWSQAAVALACWDIMRCIGRCSEALIQYMRRMW